MCIICRVCFWKRPEYISCVCVSSWWIGFRIRLPADLWNFMGTLANYGHGRRAIQVVLLSYFNHYYRTFHLTMHLDIGEPTKPSTIKIVNQHTPELWKITRWKWPCHCLPIEGNLFTLLIVCVCTSIWIYLPFTVIISEKGGMLKRGCNATIHRANKCKYTSVCQTILAANRNRSRLLSGIEFY